jgi:uncharacterized protein YidB (DUF937 family)
MGLMDILNGMQNGPRGAPQGAPASRSSGGMSPMMMALLGLLAYKAIKGGGLENILRGSPAPAPAPTNRGGNLDSGNASGGGLGGSLGDILGGVLGGGGRPGAGGDVRGGSGGLGGVLGGLLGGGAAGSILNGGLRNLIGDMEENGQGGAARSWVSNGANQPVAPGDLANALGAEDIDAVAQQTGMSRDEVLAQLSQHLPEFVNQLTPEGRLPTDHEASSRW